MFMVFIWLGALLPPKYEQTMKDCEDYPGNTCILLQDFHYKYYMEKYKDLLELTEQRVDEMVMVEKSDVLRLLYLYDKGGIYSDVDNKIDYACLEKFIENANETQFFSHEQKEDNLPSNNFIYAPTPKDPKIEFVIKKIH